MFLLPVYPPKPCFGCVAEASFVPLEAWLKPSNVAHIWRQLRPKEAASDDPLNSHGSGCC